MDFRIQATIDNLLETLGIGNGDFDRVSIPGGAGSFGQVIDDLDLSAGLHNAQIFILTVHEDCGAGKTKQDLIDATARARKLFPNREVRSFYIYLNGSWEEI